MAFSYNIVNNNNNDNVNKTTPILSQNLQKQKLIWRKVKACWITKSLRLGVSFQMFTLVNKDLVSFHYSFRFNPFRKFTKL
jgi:hypothetical protein